MLFSSSSNRYSQEKLQKLAVALKYKYNEDTEPMVIASGSGRMAEKIIEVAKEHDIPQVKDDPLARLLRKVRVGSPIPDELYGVVAEVIAMVYRMDKKVQSGETI